MLGLHCPARCRTPQSDTGHTAAGLRGAGACNPVPRGTSWHKDPPWLPPALQLRSARGRLSPLPPRRAVGRGPGSSPRGAGLPPAHITSSGGGDGDGGGGGGKAPLPVCPPRHSLRLLRAPAGPSHSLAIFRVALSAQLSPRRRLPPRAPLPPRCAALTPAETPLPAHPDPAVRWGSQRDRHGTGEHEGGTWGPVLALGSGAARLHPPMGCFGDRGLFSAASQGPQRRCSPGTFGVLPGCVEVGAPWGEGLGALNPHVSRPLCPACALGASVSHYGDGGGAGDPSRMGRHALRWAGWFGGRVLLCAMPGPGRGGYPDYPGCDPPGFRSVAPAGAVGSCRGCPAAGTGSGSE